MMAMKMQVWISTAALFDARRGDRIGRPMVALHAYLKRPDASRDWTRCEMTVAPGAKRKRKAGR